MTHNRDPNETAHGGGEQGEQLEGSFTSGGATPGVKGRDEDRGFGAGDDGEEGRASDSAGESTTGRPDQGSTRKETAAASREGPPSVSTRRIGC